MRVVTTICVALLLLSARAFGSVVHVALPTPAVAQGFYMLDQYGYYNPNTSGVVQIDLDGDGYPDFQARSFELYPSVGRTSLENVSGTPILPMGRTVVEPFGTGRDQGGNPFLALLAAGTPIGAANLWSTDGLFLADSEYFPPHVVGDLLWADGQEHYVGLALTTSDGQTHYGWLGAAI